MPATVVCFFSGILIELDHHLDYWIVRGHIPWRYAQLKEHCFESRIEKVYVFFHSWEQQIFLWTLIGVFHLGWVWIGLVLGMTTHMIADAIANPFRPLGYALLYRCYHQFDANRIFKEGFLKNDG